MQGQSQAESTLAVRSRILAARARQLARQGCLNGRLGGRQLHAMCRLAPDADKLLGKGVAKLTLSGRAVTRVLRVARTLADLEASIADLEARHVAEALQFRVQDAGL
jgi:magnesium chelatase family protein